MLICLVKKEKLKSALFCSKFWLWVAVQDPCVSSPGVAAGQTEVGPVSAEEA